MVEQTNNKQTERHSIGKDLANVAATRAANAMRDALALCETRQDRLMVAIQVFTVVGGQACAVIAAHTGARDLTIDEAFPMLLKMMKAAKPADPAALSQKE